MVTIGAASQLSETSAEAAPVFAVVKSTLQSASACSVISAGHAMAKVGAVSSVKVRICSTVVSLPQSSMAVYVRMKAPIGITHPPLTGSSAKVIATPPQASFAVAYMVPSP